MEHQSKSREVSLNREAEIRKTSIEYYEARDARVENQLSRGGSIRGLIKGAMLRLLEIRAANRMADALGLEFSDAVERDEELLSTAKIILRDYSVEEVTR